MSKLTIKLSNSFRDHSLVIELENALFSLDTYALIAGSFAKEIVDTGAEVISAKDVQKAMTEGREWFHFDLWLVDIYYLKD